jgi:hypothetical protein
MTRAPQPYREDYLSGEGATLLASILSEFWRARGYEIQTHIVHTKTSKENKPRYDVRSDLLNGIPRAHPPIKLPVRP